MADCVSVSFCGLRARAGARRRLRLLRPGRRASWRRVTSSSLLADGAGFGIGIVDVESRGLERHLEDFGQVEGVAVGALGDLLAATEAVGDDEPVGRGVADGGEEFEFADGHGDVVLVVLEAEGSGHAAASGGGGWKSTPMRWRSDSSAVIFMIDL